MIPELVDAMHGIGAVYFYFSEGNVVKKAKGAKGGDCVTSLAEISMELKNIKGASDIVMEASSWEKKLKKKYSIGDNLDSSDSKKLSDIAWKWYLKLRSISQEFEKERVTLNLIEERLKKVEKGVDPILDTMKDYITSVQASKIALVESSPTTRSLEPALRGLLNKPNQGELVLTGYFDQYLLKVFQNISQQSSIKFISPELSNSKSDKINLDALKRLKKMGAEIRFHPMLHARIVLGASEIIVGSADIKSDCLGGRRYDLGIWSNNPSLISSGNDFIEKVWNESTPLS